MYHLDVGGKQITNMRLSPKTIMEIFTGQITNWDDQQITKDYGAQLPSMPITPVVRSDGSGATYFFTRWMSHLFPSQWDAFCYKVTHGRVSAAVRADRVLPARLRQRQGRERLQQRRHLHHLELRQRRHRLRRVRLRAQLEATRWSRC